MNRDWADIWGGLALGLLGAGVAIYAGLRLDFGSLRAMGPGFFPTVLGVALAVLGAAVALPAWNRAAESPKIAWGDASAVIGAILIFGFGMNRLGILLACFAAVLIASLPAPHDGWRWRILLAASVTLLCWAVFILGLRMSIPVFPKLP
ncbi:tripartite tricarboxylate transporter TctB family protein [Paracoccus xiamenensis]|uniref:tripartite tricarboxylate transporter TctB family protein n=1 Tax=Paracoccus xiamenensis TaxID=2714901 RepID=UPI001408EC87|nr:tripartite tricarboxylate transporter TctB family protein [Paracoccus xiamenensis]NHF72780.1 tripartite tricarboxylate transporter TctB family protein [Paracoccus xiamenensis]